MSQERYIFPQIQTRTNAAPRCRFSLRKAAGPTASCGALLRGSHRMPESQPRAVGCRENSSSGFSRTRKQTFLTRLRC